MKVGTYRRGLSEPDHVKHLDASRAPGRVLPGDIVTHVKHGGNGIVISVNATEINVLWSVEPTDPLASMVLPLVRRAHVPLIANQLVSVQPMTMPSAAIFYHDYTYGSGSKGEKLDDEVVK